MRHFSISAFIVLGLFCMVGCQKSVNARPKDFSFSYHLDTGSLPPQFHYSYTVKVDANGNGQVLYENGYGNTGTSQSWTGQFNVTGDDLDKLYQQLLAKNFFRQHWVEGQPLIGGQWSTLDMTANGQEYFVPSDSTMQKDDRQTAAEMYQIIKFMVPPSIWDEINTRNVPADATPGT